MSDTKKPWQSKTLLLNGIGGLILFVSLFLPQASEVGAWITGNGALIATIWSFANIALRFITKDKIVLGD